MFRMFDCVIVGGGIAGLQAAIQLGRYQHKVVVIDSSDGRSNLCRCYHNVLGFPNGVSGQELRNTGRRQAESLGVHFLKEKVEKVSKRKEGFEFKLSNQQFVHGKRLLFATGVKDRIPLLSEIKPCLGISVYVCPDCDGYEIKDKKALILGSGDVGANMALTLHYFSKDLTYINHERKPISESVKEELENKKIEYVNSPIRKVITEGSQLKKVMLEDNRVISANHAFVAFGGNKVNSELAEDLGVELYKNKHILVDQRKKMTNVEHVWAAGDVVAHSEQVTIAMGDGMQAAIWIHKTLLSTQ
ncbi:NAD(P)/FAD-dependent oxidoreductase [Radiobacillus kanasensis]|uniref:NAD(P)/FAD-dependent oxidoreductase n=1 Tax=Radiobacillus kanasensis TaxID=2844358 RepID=UPI001E55E79C|nr:NAD(P)/FAD-dependent oxidoreductase [Radiobacillus kanasensis]UFT99151.1 NAD(P)/FAD-dependent oxidoreductase [Radiobacillus kanasensis]